MEDVLLAIGVLWIFGVILKDSANTQFANFMESIGATDSASDLLNSGNPLTPNIPMTPANSPDSPSVLQQFADAIFNHEGGQPGNLNVRNNNPGNLKFAGQPGATEGANGFAVFGTIDEGWQALYAQINKWATDFPTLTLQQFFAKYLGQADYLSPRTTSQGDPIAYAKDVAGKLGVSPTATLGTIFGGATNG